MTLLKRNTRARRSPVLEINADETKMWKIDGVLHREDGPAVEYADGDREWYLHGQLHRDDGPAVELNNGTKAWYRHGRRHRDDGPAIEQADGTKQWYLHDQRYTKPDWLREVLRDRPLTVGQRELLHALSENWDGTPNALYETATNLAT